MKLRIKRGTSAQIDLTAEGTAVFRPLFTIPPKIANAVMRIEAARQSVVELPMTAKVQATPFSFGSTFRILRKSRKVSKSDTFCELRRFGPRNNPQSLGPHPTLVFVVKKYYNEFSEIH